MTKLPFRIVLPVVLGLATAAGIILLLTWQLRTSTTQVSQELRDITRIVNRLGQTSSTPGAPLLGGDTALLHLRRGDLAALEGDWKTAEEEYRQSVEAGGGLPALLKLARAELQRRQYDQLRGTLKDLRREGAHAEDLLLLEVLSALRTGELAEAEELLKGAQDSPHRRYGQSLLALIQGNHDQARQDLDQVARGWDPALRASSALILEAYRTADLFPKSPEAHRRTLLARALAEVQECELALPLLAEALREEPDYRDAWMIQGYCELTTERAEQALESFDHAYSVDPEKPEVQYFLGRTHAALGDHQSALTFLQYALRNGFQPEAEVRRRIAASAIATGDDALALTQYRALLEAPNADLHAYETFIAVALSLGEKEEAHLKAEEAATKWPEEAASHELLGWTLAELGRTDEARAALEKALSLDPTLESAQGRLENL